MTARQVFEATAIELSKLQAPVLKLYEFNYLFNKAINQYINKVYNVYDINQQSTDDLRVLKSTTFLTPHKVELSSTNSDSAIQNISKQTGNLDTPSGGYTGQASSYLSKAHRSIQTLHGATYEVYMPIDYLHLLNCVCIYYVAKQKDCWDAGSYIEIPAIRLTSDSWSSIISDIYNRPSPMRPYYYIHNLNQQQALPTNPRTDKETGTGLEETGTDMKGEYQVTSSDESDKSNFQRTFKLKEDNSERQVSLVEKPIALRAGNTSNVRCEIRYGKILQFAHYHSNMINERDNIGEGCDANTELTNQIAKG